VDPLVIVAAFKMVALVLFGGVTYSLELSEFTVVSATKGKTWK